MKNKFYAMLIGGVLLSGTAVVQADAFAEENFSASVWLTSDYIFRGQSFSDDDPAVQASLDWGYGSWYAGIWGSSLELTGYDSSGYSPGTEPGIELSSGEEVVLLNDRNAGSSSVEFDLYVGHADSIGAIDYDAMLIYYWFPNDRGSLEADVLEFWLTLSHTFADMSMSPTVGVFGAYSPDATLEDGDSVYGKAFLALDLGNGFGLDFAVGVTEVDGDDTSGSSGAFCFPRDDPATPVNEEGALCDGYGFTHWEVGLSTTVKGFGVDLRYHDTNEQKSHVAFWGGTENIDDRIVLTVSR